jgi:WD40 repeat protein
MEIDLFADEGVCRFCVSQPSLEVFYRKSQKCTLFYRSKEIEDDPKAKLRVTMLTWDKSDQWVITASSDNSIKVWDSFTGVLIQTLIGHKDETYVIESHPLDSKVRIVLNGPFPVRRKNRLHCFSSS